MRGMGGGGGGGGGRGRGWGSGGWGKQVWGPWLRVEGCGWGKVKVYPPPPLSQHPAPFHIYHHTLRPVIYPSHTLSLSLPYVLYTVNYTWLCARLKQIGCIIKSSSAPSFSLLYTLLRKTNWSLNFSITVTTQYAWYTVKIIKLLIKVFQNHLISSINSYKVTHYFFFRPCMRLSRW